MSLFSLYGPLVRQDLSPRRIASLALGSSLQAGGQAALALAAGKCAGALAGGEGLLAGGSIPAAFAPRPVSALAFACAGLIAVTVKAVGGTWAEWEEARTRGDVGAALRLRLLDAWLARHARTRASPTSLRQPRHTDQGSRSEEKDHDLRALAAMTDHVRELEAGLGDGVLGGARAALQLAPLAVLLVVMQPRLAAVAAGVFLVFGLALGRARRAWKQANARAVRNREELLDAAEEAVRHAELWTTYGAEARIRAHLGRVGAALANHAARVAASAAALSGINEVLGALALVLAIASARAGWLGGAREAKILPFAVTFFLAYRPVRDWTESRIALARARAAADAVAPLLATAASSTLDRPVRAWSLETLTLDDVVLAHGVKRPIAARIEGGSIVAVVGPTGSGKSTLVRTLLGLESATAGSVRYGDSSLNDASAGPSGRPFAWVPQDAPVLADTLAANVALADGATSAADALDAIGAGSFASALGDARLGAGGRRVSGGERQWIALARAVATRLPVLLLDEPTSGLDAASQARVLACIERLRGHRTVLLVTHRDEPLGIAEQVIRLEGSRTLAVR